MRHILMNRGKAGEVQRNIIRGQELKNLRLVTEYFVKNIGLIKKKKKVYEKVYRAA